MKEKIINSYNNEGKLIITFDTNVLNITDIVDFSKDGYISDEGSGITVNCDNTEMAIKTEKFEYDPVEDIYYHDNVQICILE